MAKRTVSAETRKKMADAAKKRWAAKKNVTSAPTLARARRGRPPNKAEHNTFMNMSVHALVEVKRKIDEAWQAALNVLHISNKGGQRR